MANPFDYINDINDGKTDIIKHNENPTRAENDYVPYMANRSLSYSVDAIFTANQANQIHHIDKYLQFRYLLADVRKKKRFSKWIKSVQDEAIDAISTYFRVNKRVAAYYARALPQETITKISGIVNENSRLSS